MRDATGPHVAVVGAGIAGLSAAHRLHDLHPGLRLRIVEATDRLGGKLTTEHVDGFVLEGGPDSMLGVHPAAGELLAELGVEVAHAIPGSAGTCLSSRGRMYRLPDAMTGLLPRRPWALATSGLLSPWSKVRMAMEYAVPPRRDEADESIESFVTRRLGRGAYSRLAQPLVGGIFAADPALLSVLATLPHLRATERRHGGLIRGLLAEGRSPGGATAAPPLVAPTHGMGEIVAALARRLDDVEVLLSTAVLGIERADDRYRLRIESRGEATVIDGLDAVVIAVPAFVAASALARLAPGVADLLRQTGYASTVTVSLGFREKDVPERHRDRAFLTPPGEGVAIRACTWSSRKFDGRAPAGHVLLRMSLGGPGRPSLVGLTDEEIVGLTRRELAATIGLEAEPVVAAVRRWDGLMPQYAVHHRERTAEVERRLAGHEGLVLAGSGYHGVSVGDCIASGRRAAAAVATMLSALPPETPSATAVPTIATATGEAAAPVAAHCIPVPLRATRRDP